jgi:hypothetical protein
MDSELKLSFTIVCSFMYAFLCTEFAFVCALFACTMFACRMFVLHKHSTCEMDMFEDLYGLMYKHVDELIKVRNEIISVHCDLDKQHIDTEENMKHEPLDEAKSVEHDTQVEQTPVQNFEGVLFDDCFSLKFVTVENLYDALDILLNRKVNLPMDKDHLIKMYLTEIYRRGMWNGIDWWKYDQVTCIACMKQFNTECNVCLPVNQLPPEESKVVHDMIVDCQWWDMLNRLKPIVKERRDEIKQIKQHSLKLM